MPIPPPDFVLMSGSRTGNAPTSPVAISAPSLAPHDLLQVFCHSDIARIPFRSSDQATGFNLYSAESKIMPIGGRVLVDMQLSILVPEGTYGCIAPHSGLAVKFGLTTGASVINPNYRSKVYILLFNLGKHELEISVSDCIAQLILKHVAIPMVAEVDNLNSIPLEAPAS